MTRLFADFLKQHSVLNVHCIPCFHIFKMTYTVVVGQQSRSCFSGVMVLKKSWKILNFDCLIWECEPCIRATGLTDAERCSCRRRRRTDCRHSAGPRLDETCSSRSRPCLGRCVSSTRHQAASRPDIRPLHQQPAQSNTRHSLPHQFSHHHHHHRPCHLFTFKTSRNITFTDKAIVDIKLHPRCETHNE